jgi:hypothetical protein
MTRPQKSSRSPRFEPGDRVRGKSGVTAPDYEDIPLGGWAGTVTQVEQADDQITYEITWDEKTLRAMHPVYKKRCERDDLDPETMWLGEVDIEADDGTPVVIEQPTEIRTSPLSLKDQDDRVRMAFGLTHDDPLPEISPEALRTYHRYLVAKLRFPFPALYGEEEIGPFSRRKILLTVTGLLDPETEALDLDYGLVGTGWARDEVIEAPLSEIEVRKKDPNARLVSDYAYWFHNWPLHDDQEAFDEDDSPPRPWGLLKTVVICGIAGSLLGATIRAALKSIPSAGLAALIGGIPLALLGAFLLGRYGLIFGAVNRLRYSTYLGVVLGLLIGGLLGTLAGMAVVAFPWSLLGIVAGLIIGPRLMARRWRRLGSYLGTVLGVCGSLLIVAYRHDPGYATAGIRSGSILGLIAGVGLLFALIGSLSLFPPGPMESDGTEDETSEPGGDDQDDDVDDILPMRPTSKRER